MRKSDWLQLFAQPEEPAQAGENAGDTAPDAGERQEDFEDLIRGRYKADFDARVRKILDGRLRGLRRGRRGRCTGGRSHALRAGRSGLADGSGRTRVSPLARWMPEETGWEGVHRTAASGGSGMQRRIYRLNEGADRRNSA